VKKAYENRQAIAPMSKTVHMPLNVRETVDFDENGSRDKGTMQAITTSEAAGQIAHEGPTAISGTK
jgi:hypothetical protein